MKAIKMYIDSSCSNVGMETNVGGWNTILQYGQSEKILHGFESSTTNQRMLLTAIIEGIKALHTPCEIEILTDSSYVCETANKMKMYISRGWRNMAGKEIGNKELWQEIINTGNTGKHHIKFIQCDKTNPYAKCCSILAKNQVQAAIK